MVAVFALPSLGGVGLAEGVSVGSQLGVQATGVIAVLVWSVIASFIILKITAAVTGLRADDDEITGGMDLAYHGEQDYNF